MQKKAAEMTDRAEKKAGLHITVKIKCLRSVEEKQELATLFYEVGRNSTLG